MLTLFKQFIIIVLNSFASILFSGILGLSHEILKIVFSNK